MPDRWYCKCWQRDIVPILRFWKFSQTLFLQVLPLDHVCVSGWVFPELLRPISTAWRRKLARFTSAKVKFGTCILCHFCKPYCPSRLLHNWRPVLVRWKIHLAMVVRVIIIGCSTYSAEVSVKVYLHCKPGSISSVTLMLFYKIRRRLSPQNLQGMLPNPSSHSGYQFRKMSCPVPKVKKSSTPASFFFPRAIILWNLLPANLHSVNTLSKFRSELRKAWNFNNMDMCVRKTTLLLSLSFPPFLQGGGGPALTGRNVAFNE